MEKVATGNKQAIRNKKLKKRENGNWSRLGVMRHIEVTKDNEHIGENKLLLEQKEVLSILERNKSSKTSYSLSDGDVNDNINNKIRLKCSIKISISHLWRSWIMYKLTNEEDFMTSNNWRDFNQHLVMMVTFKPVSNLWFAYILSNKSEAPRKC